MKFSVSLIALSLALAASAKPVNVPRGFEQRFPFPQLPNSGFGSPHPSEAASLAPSSSVAVSSAAPSSSVAVSSVATASVKASSVAASSVVATSAAASSGASVASSVAPSASQAATSSALLTSIAATTTATESAAATSTASAGDNAGSGSAAAGGGDLQSSLTLDPSVIATFNNDGQDVAEAGQVASLTSTNNYINFCATVPQLPLTDGLQIATGSCNPAPMGIIAATTNMPSSKFVFPQSGSTVPANTNFTIQMKIKHLVTGNFVNAAQNYFSAPQQTDATTGDIKGHSHVVIDTVPSANSTEPTDPTKFAFFKGLNAAADANGILTALVPNGLPAGSYRLASINSAANHQPVLVAVAQHGALDDMVYFTVA